MERLETRGDDVAVRGGPCVWEVVRLVQELDVRGRAALELAARRLHLEVADVAACLVYFADHVDQVNARIAAADAEEDRAAERDIGRWT